MSRTPPISKEEIDFALRGNRAAWDFIEAITNVIHFWDDLIDKDREVSPAEIHENFHRMLVTIPRNPFYRENLHIFLPVFEQAILSWRTANELEEGLLHGGTKTPELDAAIAFIIRSDYLNVILVCARIIGGFEHALACAVRVRRLWHDEGLAGYQDNLRKQETSRRDSHGV